ncbi:hypothetical protein SGPA1_10813 [Streptomyces misionensis JCM 4497]
MPCPTAVPAPGAPRPAPPGPAAPPHTRSRFRGDFLVSGGLVAQRGPRGPHSWESRVHAGLAWRGISARRHL